MNANTQAPKDLEECLKMWGKVNKALAHEKVITTNQRKEMSDLYARLNEQNSKLAEIERKAKAKQVEISIGAQSFSEMEFPEARAKAKALIDLGLWYLTLE